MRMVYFSLFKRITLINDSKSSRSKLTIEYFYGNILNHFTNFLHITTRFHEGWVDGRKHDWKELKANRWAWWRLMIFAITLLFKEDHHFCVSNFFFPRLHIDFFPALFIILYRSPVRSWNSVLLLENLIKPVFAYWSLQIKSFDLSNHQVVHLHHCTMLHLLSELHHTWHLWLSLSSSDGADWFCKSKGSPLYHYSPFFQY